MPDTDTRIGSTRISVFGRLSEFNSPVAYKKKFYSWDSLIRLKAQELAQYVVGRRAELDFGEPKAALHRTDSEAIRNRILSLTTVEARRHGIRRGSWR